ncbi:hypothetical protein BTN49_0880 [Candidatus Enterovibrio escicola]|uniref:Mobile element protein n=1 Tax=Candidatus Enterovibrio escicola TaxID=1927127 RepID=A0A2A5T6Z9_9GAMM|nr:hypothetical protein BTN49_0880 [Candidatus Enterovibrio escacola]
MDLTKICLERIVTLKKEVDILEFIIGTRKEELTPLVLSLVIRFERLT